ncbi:MAG TPA: hypothetical protein VF701_03195 [Thermoanaerobaculia bacterium]
MNAFSEISGPTVVWTGKVMLQGSLVMPARPLAAAVFASFPTLPDETRDAAIASLLREAHIATLHVPLLSEEEIQFDASTSHYRNDAEFLAQRFIDIGNWVTRNHETAGLPLAYLGSSSGAAGAIVAAAQRPDLVSSVVSIDGRTDLAVDYLRDVKAPTLLLVKDMPVLRMNREALSQLRGERRIEIVHGAECHATDCVVQKSVHWLEDTLTLVSATTYGMF